MEKQHASDERLVKLLQGGDKGAFEEIYFRCQRPVYRFALHMSGSPGVAEEITQEVFLFLLQNCAEYSAVKGTLPAFLVGVARNRIRHWLRQEVREEPLDDSDTADDPVLLMSGDPLEEAMRKQSIDAVWRALLRMPQHHREVVAMCDLNEMSYSEAAQVLGVPIGTVRSRLHRAHAELADRLFENHAHVAGQRTGS